MAIQIKTLEQLKKMRVAGLVVAEALRQMREAIVPGATTLDLDAIAVKVLKEHGATSNFLNYHGYPNVICASVNHEVVHGIPNTRKFVSGDIISIDFGAIVDGWHGDSAFSVGVGKVDPEDQKLIDTCEESMWRGIAAGSKGAHLSDIGHAIEEYVNSQGKYGILREYGGHGIGTSMHMEPHVLNYGRPGQGPDLVEGICLAIEPMITRGTHKTKVLGDDWTVISQDKSRGSHFENSYCIAPDGKPFVLTALDGGKSELGRLGIEISDLL